MSRPWTLLTVVLGLALVPTLGAQSLGDVARQEQERRKAVVPGRVYTNDNLKPSPAPTSVPEAAPPSPSQAQAQVPSQPAAGEAPKGVAGADSQKKDEAYWRDRLQSERLALERAKVLVDALQSRVNGLQTDFVNRDDPATRSVISSDRQRALLEIDRTKAEMAQRNKAIADIQEEARKAGAPAGWYR